jgi:hypothetical protein
LRHHDAPPSHFATKGKAMFGCCYLAAGSSDTHLMNMRIEENGNVVSNKSAIFRLESTKQKNAPPIMHAKMDFSQQKLEQK